MAVRTTETFDVTGIEQASLQFGSDVDVIQCMGSLNGTTEMRVLTRTCKGVQSSIATPQKLIVTMTLFMPVETARDLYGLESQGLKDGVYAYSATSKSKEFAFVARFRDDFEDKQKIIAIPKGRATSGLNFSADDEQTDLAKLTLEFEASLDEMDNLYYEAMIGTGGITETEAKKWEQGFTSALVKGSSL